MSPEQNLKDLERHRADFEARRGFTFTVLDPVDGDVIGCVYIYPTRQAGHDVQVQSWVRADHATEDDKLAQAVADWWLPTAWQRPCRTSAVEPDPWMSHDSRWWISPCGDFPFQACFGIVSYRAPLAQLAEQLALN